MTGIPAGSILHLGGKTVLNRLQDAGLQDPRVPTETVYETGNDLVVGKVLTEADFRFQLTSWDVSTDLMALLGGKTASLGAQLSASDAAGTVYYWENAGFINVTSPWKSDTGTQGGHIQGGVIVPQLFPTSLNYRLGTTENAQQQLQLSCGSYYMSENQPLEETAAGNGTIVAFITSQPASVHRIGGSGSTRYRYVYGVMVNGVPQIEGVDYTVSGGAAPEVAATAVTITFAVAPPAASVVRYCYFSTSALAIPQADNLATSVVPAAVRGRDITIIIGTPSVGNLLHGVQSFELAATCSGQLQRELGQTDPIGYLKTGIDTNGTVNLEPKDIDHLYITLATLMNIDKSEVFGHINQFTFKMTVVIHDPTNPANILKSIYVPQAVFQLPGENVRVQQVTQFPLRWEAQNGTFREVKGQLPTDSQT